MSVSILIIEDDLMLAQGLKENLFEMGYESVEIASNYRAAMEKSREINPDLCLVDITLEGSRKNGIETTRELQDKYDIPYIYLTSMDDEATRAKAKSTNPAAYLIKPASTEQLEATIDIAMSNFYRMKSVMEDLAKGIYSKKNKVFVKIGERYQCINVDEIIYLEASGGYCFIHTSTRKYMVSHSLKAVLVQLNAPHIIRCHKTYAVSENHITSFDQSSLYMDLVSKVAKVPLSRSYKEVLMGKLARL